MKILITGANGMLSLALKKKLRPKNKLILTDIHNMDITKAKKVSDFFNKTNPEIVIHAAAYTDVDGAEANKALALKINRDGTRNVALVCKKLDIPIVYISTDYIFGGGKKKPYTEKNKPNPLSVYGFSKYAGEKEIRRITKKHYITRSAWLYGPGGKNFVMTILRLASELDELKIVNDQRGCPTYTFDLAEVISKLIKNGKYGTYHVVNSGSCTWFQFAKEILKIKKIKKKVIPITSKELNRPAKRPTYSVLSNKKVKKTGVNLRPWQKALANFLETVPS
ncbi:MAG: dTDP-4-dehydrorhamnose reductase [Candidatus Berkelbacteria bacterium]|nr:dTDP-4-dehydrorhamnose reductase [Candidatus Berkelbacteria bacterium]